MNFTDAIKTCYTKYADFEGRASRSEYWWFYLFRALLGAAAMAIDPAGRLVGLIFVANLLPGIAAGVRRLHDLGRPGWWYALMFVPLLNLLVLVWLIMEGTKGPNAFGPDPVTQASGAVTPV